MSSAANKPYSEVKLVQVGSDRAGQRVDNFLAGHLKKMPRSLIYRLLRTGQVRINGKRAKPDTRLQEGDELRIPPVQLHDKASKRTPSPRRMEQLANAIVFEDAQLLALNKPSGVASHGGSGIDFGAIETLRALRPDQELELVHRLDRDTSGLLIVAKKRSALVEMQALLREDNGAGFRKSYLALVAGRLPDGTLTVNAPLHVGLRQGGERHVQVSPQGKPSTSHFRLLERRGGQSYCEVRIETGRTHQIRAHAQHLGHPVAGDEKYGDEAVNRRLREKTGLKRLFLHAASLEFSLGNGKTPYLLTAPLPDELREVLDRLS